VILSQEGIIKISHSTGEYKFYLMAHAVFIRSGTWSRHLPDVVEPKLYPHSGRILVVGRPSGRLVSGFLVSTFTVWINSKSFLWNLRSVQETSPNFLRRSTRVDNIAQA